MSHTFYVVYDNTTQIPNGISGYPFDNIPAGSVQACVREEDGTAFIEGHQRLHDYIVIVVDGWAVFKPRYIIKRIFPDNMVQDLDYRINYFNIVGIKYSYNQNLLTLTTDYDIPESEFTVYVTSQGDPGKLLSKHRVKSSRSIEIKTTIKEPISVWATK